MFGADLKDKVGSLGSLKGPFAIRKLRIFAASIVKVGALDLNGRVLYSLVFSL